jgi:hypothetical protein
VANRLHLGTRIYEIWSKDEGCGRRRLSHWRYLTPCHMHPECTLSLKERVQLGF